MTTVGYGDMSPETLLGRVVAGFTALCGLALFAMLMQVVGKALMEGLFGTDEELEDTEASDTLEGRSFLTVSDRMRDLLELREQGLVSEEEFEQQRKRLIAQI